MKVRAIAIVLSICASTVGAQQQQRATLIDTNAVRGMIDAGAAAGSVSTTGWFWRGVLFTPLYPVGLPVVIVQARNSKVATPTMPDQLRPREYRAAYDSAYVATVRRKRRNSSLKGMVAATAALTVLVAAGVNGR